MSERPPSRDENREDEQLLRDAEFVINAMWKKAMDVNDLPLSVDSSYQMWSEDFQKRKGAFARVLFNRAREATGEEKFLSAGTLRRLTKLLNDSERSELLKELMTTQEAVDELARQAEEQVRSKQTKSERMKGKVRKTIDRILRRDDDFDDDMK